MVILLPLFERVRSFTDNFISTLFIHILYALHLNKTEYSVGNMHCSVFFKIAMCRLSQMEDHTVVHYEKSEDEENKQKAIKVILQKESNSGKVLAI